MIGVAVNLALSLAQKHQRRVSPQALRIPLPQL